MSVSGYAMNDLLPEEMVAKRISEIQDRLTTIYRAGSDYKRDSAAGACLGPALAAVGWAGEQRHLQEALPHFEKLSCLDSVRAVMARLNYETIPQHCNMGSLSGERLPCLFATNSGKTFVVVTRDEFGSYVVYDAAQDAFTHIDADACEKGVAYLIRPLDFEETRKSIMRHGWVVGVLRRFKRTFIGLFALTFVINMLGLVVPLYVMTVYDKAVGAKSAMTLGYLLMGVVIALCVDVFLRAVRARYLAYIGSRVECLVTTAAFEKLLHLPLGMTESAPVGSQVTRLKQFEAIREIFSGPLAVTIMDLPFFLVFLTAIILIGGPVGYIPVGLILVFVVMAFVTMPITRVRVRQAGDSCSESRNFLMELVAKRETIRDSGAEDVWVERYKELASRTLATQLSAQKLSMTVQTLSQSFVVVAGSLTVGVGAYMVIEGQLTPGALIAVMTLVWKVLQPIQAVFLSLNRIGQSRDSLTQVDSLMRLNTEREPGELPTFFRQFKGKLSMQRVAFRFSATSEPALRGVDLNVEPGEFVVITGHSGAGKSTIIKLMARLYQAQAGVVALDRLDLRQLDVAEIRHAIGYVPQRSNFFYGTVAQNLKLANPAASRKDMIEALLLSGALKSFDDADELLDTRLTANVYSQLPPGLIQQIMIAQAVVKKPSVYLMDEPGNNLDAKGDDILKGLFERLKGKASILIVTHRPSHMKIADRVIVMDHGLVALDGPPEEILPKLSAMQKAKSLAKS